MSFARPPLFSRFKDSQQLYELKEPFSAKLDNLYYTVSRSTKLNYPSFLLILFTFLCISYIGIESSLRVFPRVNEKTVLWNTQSDWSAKTRMVVDPRQKVFDDYHKLAKLYLAPFAPHGFDRDSYMSLMEKGDGYCDGCFLVQIKNKEIWVYDPKGVRNRVEFRELRMREALAWIKRAVTEDRIMQDDHESHLSIDNTEFVISTSDSLVSSGREHEWRLGRLDNRSLPIFSSIRCNCSDNIPFPNLVDMMRRALPEQFWNRRAAVLQQWDSVARNYSKSSARIQWKDKVSKAVFRGRIRVSSYVKEKALFDSMCNATGRSGLWHIAHPEDNGRLRDSPETSSRLDPSDFLDVEVQGTCGKRIYFNKRSSFSDQDAYKYTIYAEGNKLWADRLTMQLFGSSIIMKQETPCGQFFEPLLKPYKHYIPVDFFFRDMIRQAQWARQNDEQAQLIVKNAKDFAFDYLTLDAIKKYVKAVLAEYSSLLKNRKFDIHPGAFRYYPLNTPTSTV